jgi:hypothetical protein
MNTIGFAASNLQITGPRCTSTNNQGVILFTQFRRINVHTNMGIRNECLISENQRRKAQRPQGTYNTLLSHKIYSALHDCFVKFHTRIKYKWDRANLKLNLLRDAIHQEPPHSVISIVNGDEVPSFIKLVGACQSRWSGTNDGDTLSSSERWRIGSHPTHLETLTEI